MQAAKLPKYLTGPALIFHVGLPAPTKADYDLLKDALETDYCKVS